MNESSSLSSRIRKYRMHYIIVLPALLLLFIFKGVPFLTALYMPFTDFKPYRGIFGSSWAGMQNFQSLFQLPEFRQAFTNTIVLNVGYVFVAGVAGLLLSLALAAIRWERLRRLFSTMFLLPYFVPSVTFAYAFTIVMSPDRSPFFDWDAFWLGNSGWFRWSAIAAETLKTVGVPALIALTAIASRHEAAYGSESVTPGFGTQGYFYHTVVPAAKAVFAFALLRLSMPLTSDFELMHALLNPLVYETGDTLSTYLFRVGFQQGQYSAASAVWLFQFVLQFLFAVAAYALLRGAFANALFSRFARPRVRPGNAGANVVGIAVSVGFGAVALLPLYVLFVVPLTSGGESEVSAWSLLSVPYALAYGGLLLGATFVHMLMTVTLAYPLTVKRLPGRQFYKLVLIFYACIGPVFFHDYLFFREIGLVGSAFAIPLSGFVSIVPVFVLKSIFNAKYANLKEVREQEGRGELHAFFTLFLPNIWKAWVALGVLHLTTLGGTYWTSLLYLMTPETFPPLLQFVMLAGGMSADIGILPGDPRVLTFGAIASLPGIVLFLLFRPWLTSEVLVSQVRRG